MDGSTRALLRLYRVRPRPGHPLGAPQRARPAALTRRPGLVFGRLAIRDRLLEFLTADAGDDSDIELWAWYGAYDHVALCQLWGDDAGAAAGAAALHPRPAPALVGRRGAAAAAGAGERQHDALADARHNLARWQVIEQHWPPEF